MDQLYDDAWKDGVDRWYGQIMQPEQMNHFSYYYEKTQFFDVPDWARGLHYVWKGPHVLSDRYHMWDYGLTMDVELLRRSRGGRLPFEFMPNLWIILGARHGQLRAQTQEVISYGAKRSCVHIVF